MVLEGLIIFVLGVVAGVASIHVNEHGLRWVRRQKRGREATVVWLAGSQHDQVLLALRSIRNFVIGFPIAILVAVAFPWIVDARSGLWWMVLPALLIGVVGFYLTIASFRDWTLLMQALQAGDE